MDEAKVHVIQEWEEPIKVTELRSFLGLVNYYRQFISGYSAKAAPLTELLKKNKPWIWTEHCQKEFEGLRAAVTEEIVLALPDFAKTFERSESTGHTPFELATGQQPQTPHSLPAAFEGKSLGAYHMAKGWEKELDTAKSYLDKAAKKMKKCADRKRHPADNRVGNMVMVKFNPRQFKALWGMHQNQIRKYEGPFKIVSKIGKISYKLDMPSYLKIYHVFHASILKPYHEDKDDPRRGQSSQAPITIIASHDREIEAIMDYHARRKQGQKATAMFLIHWKWQSREEATWEQYEDLWQFKDKI
ncbi:putative mitochondrial protein [Nicotiana attenuata]|uniref:Mitochondrial protein n=1 Tax=Nicotiana attenuata TaxID=49451 RepID=A0A1J6IF16_NICAT|nr:putative mitochondrial protein [Nicotiana attenuata]